jgi:hypothetical protein
LGVREKFDHQLASSGIDGMRRHDRLVLDWCRTSKTPVTVVLAGSCAVDTDDNVQMHCNTYRELESVIGQ